MTKQTKSNSPPTFALTPRPTSASKCSTLGSGLSLAASTAREALAKDFIEHKFDLKHLQRTILKSRVYSLSSLPNDQNKADTRGEHRSRAGLAVEAGPYSDRVRRRSR